MENNETPVMAKSKSWLHRISMVILFILMGILLVSFLVHVPVVQQWGIKRITNYLGSKMETEVRVRNFDLNIFDHLVLDDIYIENPLTPGDTLLYSEELRVTFKSLLHLITGKLYIKQVEIHNGNLSFERNSELGMSTVSYLINKFANPDKKNKTGNGLDLDLKQLSLERVSLKYHDALTSNDQFFFFEDASFEVKDLDLKNKVIVGSRFDVFGADIVMSKTGDGFVEFLDSLAKTNVLVKDTVDPWLIQIEQLRIEDATFKSDNYSKSKVSPWAASDVDFDHLDLVDIDIDIDSFSMLELSFGGIVNNIHLLHKNGFEVKKLSADRASIDCNEITLEGAFLQTNNSVLRDTIRFSYDEYADFDDFERKVKIDFNSKDSRVALKDLLRLVPKLKTDAFFQQNKGQTISLNGQISGEINRLKVLNMSLAMGELRLDGDFRSRNLAEKGNEFLNLDLKRSSMDAATLEKILPGLSLPPDFNKLGKVTFRGKFFGYFEDFVAAGSFQTALGNAELDMRLALKENRDNSSFSGSVKLDRFDLGRFSGSSDLGFVSLDAAVKDGRGISKESARAVLVGTVKSLQFKGYEYRDISLNGNLNQRFFDGAFEIHDEFAEIVFNGSIDFRDSIPDYNFNAEIKTLDLHQLNIVANPLAVSGVFDVDLKALNLDRIFGTANGGHIQIRDSSENIYRLDSFSIISRYDDIDLRSIDIESDLLSGKVVGDFKLKEIVPLIKSHLKTYYPRFFPNMILPDSLFRMSDQQLAFDLSLQDSKNWFGMAGVPDLRIERLTASGTVDTKRDIISVNGFIPEFHFRTFNIYYVDYSFEEHAGEALSKIDIVASDINEKVIFEDIRLDNRYANDSILVHFNTANLTQVFDKLNIKAKILPDEGFYTFNLEPVDLEMFGSPWTIDEKNHIKIWNDRIDISEFELSNGKQEIFVDNLDEKGVKALISGFDASYIDEIWDYDKLDFAGSYILNMRIEDIFAMKGYRSDLIIPDFYINGDHYGLLEFYATSTAMGDRVDIELDIVKGDRLIGGEGYFYPPLKEVPEELQNQWQINADINKLPMSFWQYIIGDNISGTEGSMDADIKFGGLINEMTIAGNGHVVNGKTKVNYLGTTYFFHDQTFKITDEMIDLTGTILTDEGGNRATVIGGLTHRHLSNLGLNATISSPRFIGLKTSPKDNPTYYGYAIGKMLVNFSGRLNRPSISVDAETAEGTYLAIPIDNGATTAETDFVEFTTILGDTTVPLKREEILIKGMDFDMNVSVNEGAVVEIIFDEQSGEILRGSGNGNIQFGVTRAGEMTMNGLFEIEKGDYLFTNFIVRKPFIIKRGGTIRWDGDPFDALINVEAEYEKLRASVAVFIQEYLLRAGDNARSDAQIKTEVDLTLILTGFLSSPNIDFTIDFPNLTGEIKGYVDSKMRILRSDQNAMLEQVMGLLLTRSFLPSNTILNSAGSVATSSLNNTVSELISTQLSSYLSGFLSDAVEGIGFINSIDLDVGVDINPFGAAQDVTTIDDILTESGNNVDFRFSNRLFGDRIIVDVAGNYTTNSPLTTDGQYYTGDYALEYMLTDDGKWKIRFYHRDDFTIEGRRKKYGLGLAYRREFDNFAELFNAKSQKDTELD